MIRRLYILSALAALLMTGCSKDTPTEPGSSGTTTSLTFSYDLPAESTRAATVPASELEKAVYDLDIFAYEDGGAFVARLQPEVTPGDGGHYKHTIDGTIVIIDCTTDFLVANAGKTLVFYFVANNASSKSALAAHTDAIDYENLTARQFENSLCAPLPDFKDGRVNGIEDLANDFIPDSGGQSYGLLMTARSEPVRIIGRQGQKIKLIRRTARFDIRNDYKDTYEMTEIYISSAQVHGQLFGTGQVQPLASPKPYRTMYGPGASEFDAANEYPGWFYLYPTTLGEGATEITVLVTRLADDATALVKVEATEDIKANYRYTLVFNAANLTFTFINGQGNIIDGGTNP